MSAFGRRRYFAEGQRVHLIRDSIGLRGRATSPMATVLIASDGYMMKIQRDGIKHAEWWSPLHFRLVRATDQGSR